MPLRRGKRARTKAGVKANIKTELRAGKPRKQAIAIAMSLAGKSRPKRKSKGRKRR